jgi:DNA-binding transcriptional MerR regulator
MGEFTIDELARRANTTSRNIRAYQERGLLPSPRLAGRVGYYGEGHLARLRHIAEMLDRGFTLASIRQLFEAWERGYGLADVLGFEEALIAPWDHEDSSLLTLEELTAMFGLDMRALAQAVRIGVLVAEGEKFRVPSPRLLDAARELVAADIPLRSIVGEAEDLVADLDRVAERWMAMFQAHKWDDYVARGMPADELQSLTEFLQRMRPLLGSIIAPLLAQAMERRGKELAADTFGTAPPPKGKARRRAS